MVQPGSRKRPAPGASPIGPQVQLPMNYNPASAHITSDQYLNWQAQNDAVSGLQNYPDPSANFSSTVYDTIPQQSVASDPSNQLARRPPGQHMVTRGGYAHSANDTWDGAMDGVPLQPEEEAWNNDDAALAARAEVAKREAISKRKSIPPFVQKLSSFLDESRNTDLIRWTSSGNSFVVLDEDEFAKTLIPELFKHNNYASFVRQLNMYGFHKKVGLSDNSMRASERKNKSPSEYYNPYFKQHKPNLLWLIQKPKPTSTKGPGRKVKHEDGGPDDDIEDIYEGDNQTPMPGGAEDSIPSLRNARQPLMIGQGGNTLPQDELAAVHRELQQIRQQQQLISGVIKKIRQEHENLYGQAAAFQELHNRHENSINAILTFLATVYNRSLEGHGAQNLQNLFAGAIPADTQRQGSVVDVEDYNHLGPNPSNSQIRRPMRRQPLLIGAPPINSPINEVASSAASSPAASGVGAQQRSQSRLSTRQTPVNAFSPPENPTTSQFNNSTSNRSSESPRFTATGNPTNQIPESDIMSFINSANANGTNFGGNNHMDFPQALSHLQTMDGKPPLTPGQRSNVLQLMANGSANPSLNGNNTSNGNNALTSPNPPEIPLPDMEHWNATKSELDFLEKTLKEQDSKVANLSSMLQPLSPSGTIPGLSDPQGYPATGQGATDSLDFDQLFNSGDYFDDSGVGADINFGADAGDYNGDADFDFGNPNGNVGSKGFSLDQESNQNGGRIVETVDSSEATSPANTVEEGRGPEEGQSPRKKRKRNG